MRVARAGLSVGMAVALWLVVGPETASACTCGGATPTEYLSYADVVFQGIAAETQNVRGRFSLRGRTYEYEVQVTTFEVQRVWKGPKQPAFKLATFLFGGGFCGYTFAEGEDYLVYAHRSSREYVDGITLETGICEGTRLISRASDHLDEIGPGRTVGELCPQMSERIPAAVATAALANPADYDGWGRLANEGLPLSPYNGYRTWLSVRNPAVPHGPMNGVAWKAGCP